MLDMSANSHSDLGFSLPRAWHSPGNDASDPIRRTSLAFVDGANRLLQVGKAKRMKCLDQMERFGEAGDRRVVNVYLGSPELAEALAECGSTQVIPLRPMACDDEFARVAAMVFGPLGAEDCLRLHGSTRGRMGPLLHLAALRGLAPPYAVPDAEIRRLPVPPSNRTEGT